MGSAGCHRGLVHTPSPACNSHGSFTPHPPLHTMLLSQATDAQESWVPLAVTVGTFRPSPAKSQTTHPPYSHNSQKQQTDQQES